MKFDRFEKENVLINFIKNHNLNRLKCVKIL